MARLVDYHRTVMGYHGTGLSVLEPEDQKGEGIVEGDVEIQEDRPDG
jgi:hypothetical protein